MRAQARPSARALALVLLMLASTQLLLLASRDYTPTELEPETNRFDVDNSQVSVIDVGLDHSCAIGTVGQMKCWGDGTNGKTGHENTDDYGDEEEEMGQYLMFTDGGSGLTFTSVAAGNDFTCGLMSDASVKCWGSNEFLGAGVGSPGSGALGDGYLEMGAGLQTVNLGTWNATSIAAGGTHACAIVNNSSADSLACWGGNDFGELGVGDTTIQLGVFEIPHVDLPDRGAGITQVDLGSRHSCILWSDGEIGCWGSNAFGQLGIGSTEDIGDGPGEMGGSMTLVDLPSGRTASQISLGHNTTCAVLDNGDLSCWGMGTYGILGSEGTSHLGDAANEVGDNLHVLELGMGYTVDDVSVGQNHACAILDDGDDTTGDVMKCWGSGFGGALGSENQQNLGDSQFQMGDLLPYVDLGSGIQPISVEAGDSFTCAIMNNTKVKCWGSGLDGRTGQGVSGNYGDLPGDMGDNLAYVELYLPEDTLDQPCDNPAEGSPLTLSTIDSSSPKTGNKTSTALTPESCGAIAYFDETNELLKFGIFTNGRWSTEVVKDYESVWNYLHDVSIAIGSDGLPHIVSSGSLNTNSGQAHYYTKKDGEWTATEQYASTSGVGSSGIYAVGVEVDGSGDIYAIAQKSYTTGWGTNSHIDAYRCTAVGHANNSCTDSLDGGFDFDNNYIGRIIEASWSASLDTDVASDGTVYVAYLGNADSLGEESGGIEVVELDSTGFGTPMGVGGTLGRTTANSSLSMDLGLDGSFHLAYPNHGGGLNYSLCSSGCDLPASWSTEYVNGSVAVSDTGVIDISVGPDMSVVILAGESGGTSVLHKIDGSWEKTELETSGGAEWAGIEISNQGMMWAYVYYPNTGSSLSLYKQEGMTSPGLGSDVDGDGWSRVDELRCGTDYANSSSTPVDSDGDGECDLYDGWEDTSISGESESLSLGEAFGCVVLSNSSVACWGDNSEGQLGNNEAGAYSDHAVTVDLPAGFQAGGVSTGTAHACSKGLDGTLVCWGRNTEGQLGRGTASPSGAPAHATLPTGVIVNEISVGQNHNCFTGTDSQLYCWGNGSDDRTGDIGNPAVPRYQYENFTDNSRSWTSSSTSMIKGPGEGIDYVKYELAWNWGPYTLTSDSSFEVYPGDVVSFRMRAQYHGNNGHTSEYVRIYADGQLLKQIDSNATTSGAFSEWQTVSLTVPDSYTGGGAVPIQIHIRGYYQEVHIDDLKVSGYQRGGHESVLEPSLAFMQDSGAVSQISLGARHSCAMLSSGGIRCWGFNGGSYERILGDPTFTGQSTYIPRNVNLSGYGSLVSTEWGGGTADSVVAGDGVSCAMMRDGRSLCWGSSTTKEYLSPEVTTVDSDGDVGRSPTILQDASGNWRISYNDGNGISYSSHDGSSWSTTVVCSYTEVCDSTNGLGAAISGDGGLEFASYDSSSQSLVHTRKPTSVSTTMPIPDVNTNFYSIERNSSSGDLHLTYYRDTGINSQRDLMYTSFNGSGWSVPEVVDGGVGTGNSNKWKTGQSLNGLKMDSDGGLHLSYWDWYDHGSDQAHLKYAYYDGSAWSIQTLQSIIGKNNPVRHTSLAIDGNARPHIAYYDAKNMTLRYTYYDGATWVDQNLTEDDSNDNGRYASIALDSSDNPRIAFRNESSDDLEMVAWDGSSWSRETVTSTNNVGSWASIAIDNDDNTKIAYVYDSGADIMYASHDGSQWSIEAVDTTGSSNRVALELDIAGRPVIAYSRGSTAMLAYNDSGTDDVWESIELHSGYDVGDNIALTLDKTNRTGFVAYRQTSYPATRALLSIVETGNTYSSTGYSSVGSLSNAVNVGPKPVFDGDVLLATYMNGGSGMSLEFATFHAPGTSLGEIDESGGSQGLSMALDSNGDQHVAYYDLTTSGLTYAVNRGGSWQATMVDVGSGTTGYYPSIAVDGDGLPHIAYVNVTTYPRTVMYAHYNGTSWGIQTIDDPYNAYHPSIAVDSGGSAHIAYSVHNNSGTTSYNLRYSYHNGTAWAYEDIKDYRDSNWASSSYYRTGYSNQIRLNSTEVPHVVFYEDYYDDVYISVRENGTWSSSQVDDNGGYYSGAHRGASLAIDSVDGLHVAFYGWDYYALEYAYKGPGDSSWTKTVVHDQGNHLIGYSTSIAVDNSNRPHIAYLDGGNYDLEYSYLTSSNQWITRTTATPATTGYYPSIAVGDNGDVFFAYHDASYSDLDFAVIRTGAPTTEVVAALGSHAYGLGLSLDLGGSPHISTYNGSDSAGSLQYITKSGEAWSVQTVDQGSTMTGLHSDIDLDSEGNPHISYVDGTNGVLRYAHHDGASWSTFTVDASGAVVGYTSIVVDLNGYPRISYNDGSLKLAVWDGSSWELSSQDAGSVLGSDILVGRDGITRIGYFDDAASDLEFALAGHDSPLVMGNSVSAQGISSAGTSLNGNSTGIASLSLGETHGCAVISSVVKCWGKDDGTGNLGRDGGTNHAFPASVYDAFTTGWTPLEVSVSKSSGTTGGFSCAIYQEDTTENKKILCWGDASRGQLGTLSTSSIKRPNTAAPVNWASGQGHVGSPAESSSLAVGPHQVAEISIPVNGRFGCARSNLGHVKCWGYNNRGQLGQGNSSTASDGPNEMGGNLAFVALGANRTATQVTTGAEHACALLDNGSVKCWGSNANGATGMGTGSGYTGDEPGEMGDNLPIIELGSGRTVTQITSGSYHNCAILDDGSVKCWGSNSHGRTGIDNGTGSKGDEANEMGDFLPTVDLGTGRTAIAISAGNVHTCAILDSGVLKCWGHNSNGQLGQEHSYNIGDGYSGSDDFQCHPTLNDPTDRECLARMGDGLPGIDLGENRTAISVSAGYTHTCAILDNGSVKCWGFNGYGATGLGITSLSSGDEDGEMGDSLTTVDLGEGKTAASISSGAGHSCALINDLQVACWGRNSEGQLGIGSTEAVDSAEELGESLQRADLPTTKSRSVVAGLYFTCAVIDDGTVRCWGEDNDGRLGVYRDDDDNIGDSSDELGAYLPITDLQLSPPDYDGDGWIDIWDTDDDNDGYTDENDDLPFDERDWFDHDGDGLGVNVDTDDDDATVTTAEQDTSAKWSDAEELACGTLWWSSISEPTDYDGDGICDALDNDVDGNGWNNTYQTECAGGESTSWTNRGVWDSSGSWPLSSADSITGGYDFMLSDHGIRVFSTYYNDNIYNGLIRFDGTTDGISSISAGNNRYDYWSVTERNNIFYHTDESGMMRYADSNTSTGTYSSSRLAHTATTSVSTAISVEGDLVARWYEQSGGPAIMGWYLNGSVFQVNVPEGLSESSNHHGQIAFGPDGRLHVLMVNLSATTIGFYHYFADLGSSLSGSSTVEWSNPHLLLERNQSTAWSSGAQHSATEDHTADLHMSQNGTLYAAMYNQTDLHFSTFDGTSWSTEMVASSTGKNEGVTIATNSSGTAFIAWIDHDSDKLMLSHKEGSGWVHEEVWQSNGWEESGGVPTLSYARLKLDFDRQDDPYIMSIDANDTSSALLHYKGSMLDPSYTFQPTDANGDGVCDTLQFAVIDYGTTSAIYKQYEEVSLTPTFDGKDLVEVWAPSLPSGLSINNTTGQITGAPDTVDTAGTTYTIYSNSSSASYPYSITFTIRSPTPMLAGYGSWSDHQYTSSASGRGYTLHGYDDHGNLYYYGRFQTSTAWSNDGVNVNAGSGDLYVAKRWANGTWAWTVGWPMNGATGPGALAVDGSGNTYMAGYRSSGGLDLPGSEYDLPSREAAYFFSLDTNGSTRWSQDAFISGSDANWHISTLASTGNYGYTRINLNETSGDLTIAGQISSNSLTSRTVSLGNLTMEIPSTNYNYLRPFVFRINGTGDFVWGNTVTPVSNYARTLQGMGVNDDGSVELLMRAYGETVFGEHASEEESYHYVIGRLNSTGAWTGASEVVEPSAGFYGPQDTAIMQLSPSGELILAMWSVEDITNLTVNGTVAWFNESCEDSLVVMSLNGSDRAISATREFCLNSGAAAHGDYNSLLEIDGNGMPILFLGTTQSWQAGHHKIIRFDSDLNSDYEETVICNNDPTCTNLLDWDDVAFDPLGNMLVYHYTNNCNLYWNGSYMGRTSSSCNYQSHFFMEQVGHTIDGQILVEGEPSTLWGVMGLSAMGATCTQGSSYCAEYLDSWESTGLPDGLDIDPSTGVIYGSASSNLSESSFALWMNDTILGGNQINVSFSILNGRPTVSYDQTTFVLERGLEILPISPSVAEGVIINWTFVPELPAGLSLGDSNGTIYGTPMVNLTQQTFQLRVSSEGGTTMVNFQITINEPIANISYGNGTYIIPRDAMVDIAPTVEGGVVETFEINSTSFPLGLSFNTTNGHFQGVPLLVTNQTTYTIWANNSGGSTSTEVTIWIVGNGIFLTFPTSDLYLTDGVAMQPIAGQTSGSTPESWEIYPDLPLGLFFGGSNGTIWGTPTNVQNQTNYTIWANASGAQTSSVNLTITVLIDTDGDTVADVNDEDDDNDGWNDTSEISCGTDPLDPSIFPSDVDSDGLCDALDETDDRAIAMTYPVNNLDLVVNISSVSLMPITSGGEITSWESSQAMPDGMQLNNTTGEISGTPLAELGATPYTIWANNSAYTSSFNLTIAASLLDTDGDGEPDITDEDDDNDGWSDSNESLCLTDPLDEEDSPADSDGDGECNLIDSVDDSPIFMVYPDSIINLTTNVTTVSIEPTLFGGDVRSWEMAPEAPSGLNFNTSSGILSGISNSSFEYTDFTVWANNSQHISSFVINISSWRIDTDGDGIPDETDTDDDDDGWADDDEVSCLTDLLDETSMPSDSDGDGVCDTVDVVDDSPISMAYSSDSVQLIVNITPFQLTPIVFGGDVRTWEIRPILPDGLNFSESTGLISGLPNASFNLTEFTIWANNSQYSSNFSINISSSLLDSDGDGVPDEIDLDDDNDGWADANETGCLTDSLDPLSYPTDGDGDGDCDGIDDTDDSPIFLVYSETSQLLFVNEPIEPIVATTFGGDVRTWEVWPPLPAGLKLNGGLLRSDATPGTITGAPMSEFEIGVFTVWANNSQFHSSVDITLQSVVPDPDDDYFDLIYLDDSLNLTTFYDEVYLEPQIFGGNVSSWSISPDLPEGLDFNSTNGVISGSTLVEANQTLHTVTGSNSLYLNTFDITITSTYRDTDEDGLPDLFDPDDDGDGWNDTLEIECGTDSLNIISSPSDYDEDHICDPVDDFDDSPIVFFYPIDKLILTVGEEMEPLDPLVAPTSGGIAEFTVIPNLPAGLTLNSTTGVISGTPLEPYRHILVEYSHTFTAKNSQWEFSYRVDFDIFFPVDNNPDSDADGWSDILEIECSTDPEDVDSFPEDIDLDGVCSFIDEDDDGDNIGDEIDMFPSDPTAWDDTDNDTMPDDLTCIYLTDSANCSFTLEEDLDDDNDGWPDLNETSCGTDPRDNLSVPRDDDGDGICNLLEEYVPEVVRILWICCFPILLLLLLLLWLINPFTVIDEEIMGPEPEFTYTESDWVGGSGEFDDPFLLKPVKGVRKGSFAQSHELIKVTNISPRHKCEFTDMASEENGTRFEMRPIRANSRGEIEFRLDFRDDGDTKETTNYKGMIRLGKSTVYFQWEVEVEVFVDTPEEEIAKKRASRIEREAKKKAAEIEKKSTAKVAEAEIEAKKIAAQVEKEAKNRIEKIEKEADERAAAAELKAIEAEKKAAMMQKEAAEREAELERQIRKQEAERIEQEEEEARLAAEEKARKESEEAAERERLAEEEAAELRAMLKKKAEQRKAEEEAEKAEQEALRIAEEAEKARLEREEKEEAERVQREEKEEAERVQREFAKEKAERERQAQMRSMEAKEKLRKRALEIKKEREKEQLDSDESRRMASERLAKMEDQMNERRERLEDLSEEQRKREISLLRVTEKSKNIDFGIIGFASESDKDDLQEISGIGPFIEEKLNALGIFTFLQISKMDSDLEDKVNDAIEFFPGRIKRDEWVKKARDLAGTPREGLGTSMGPEAPSDSDLVSQAKEDMEREKIENQKRDEIRRRKEMAEELLKRSRGKSPTKERTRESGIDLTAIGFGSEEDKDDLKQIDGIGRFVEEKLNAIGIYKISQIAKMSPDMANRVNEAVGLGPGRIERDEWVAQANRMIR